MKSLPYILAGGGLLAALVFASSRKGGGSSSPPGGSDGDLGLDTGEAVQEVLTAWAEGLVSFLNQCADDGDIRDPRTSAVDFGLAVTETATCAAEYVSRVDMSALTSEQQNILLDQTQKIAGAWLEMWRESRLEPSVQDTVTELFDSYHDIFLDMLGFQGLLLALRVPRLDNV